MILNAGQQPRFAFWQSSPKTEGLSILLTSQSGREGHPECVLTTVTMIAQSVATLILLDR